MKIAIPRRMDLESSLNFCNILASVNKVDENEYIYDYKDLSSVEPFGMLLIASKIRWLVDEKENCTHKDTNFKSGSSAKSYAANMGFYHSVYQEFGKRPGEARGSETYIPITELDFEKLRVEDISIYDHIEKVSAHISNILSRGDKNLGDYLSYSIRELIRNVLEHSGSNSLWYAGQYWKSNGIVEVAILDEGIGIKNSVEKSKKIKVMNDFEAILLSLEPGISKSGIGRESKDEYDNTGFGLYMISRFCKEAGDIAICSGRDCLIIKDGVVNKYSTNFEGTAIRIRLNPNKLSNSKEVFMNASRNGTKLAAIYKKMKEITTTDIVNI